MKFEARSLGVFEILTARQEKNEVFDADRFRAAVNLLLERKVRQLVVDLSGVDYLYSDAINALVSINRRILEQAGRMSLLAPQAKVHEILLRSGLDSLFRIYKSEGELSAESMELLRQSTLMTRDRDPNSSTGYALAVKTPAPIPEGPNTRQHRRRSGSRKDVVTRRPAGRKDSVFPPDAPAEDSIPAGDSTLTAPSSPGSAFPSAFSWDEKPTPPQPPASPSLEIVRGVMLTEESIFSTPTLPPPAAFYPPPQPPLDEDMPTIQFRIPPTVE